MKIKQLSLVAVIGATSFLPRQCAPPDNPPTTGTPVYCDISRCNPEHAAIGVWGEEGYVQGGAECQDLNRMGPPIAVTTAQYYFGGGGSGLNPPFYLYIYCPAYAPLMTRRTAYAFSWD